MCRTHGIHIPNQPNIVNTNNNNSNNFNYLVINNNTNPNKHEHDQQINAVNSSNLQIPINNQFNNNINNNTFQQSAPLNYNDNVGYPNLQYTAYYSNPMQNDIPDSLSNFTDITQTKSDQIISSHDSNNNTNNNNINVNLYQNSNAQIGNQLMQCARSHSQNNNISYSSSILPSQAKKAKHDLQKRKVMVANANRSFEKKEVMENGGMIRKYFM